MGLQPLEYFYSDSAGSTLDCGAQSQSRAVRVKELKGLITGCDITECEKQFAPENLDFALKVWISHAKLHFLLYVNFLSYLRFQSLKVQKN